jgi:hypothetical protein
MLMQAILPRVWMQEIHAERDRELEAARQQRRSAASNPREERSGQPPAVSDGQ